MKVVLITGASSGIGKELARQFAAHDYDLVLTARRETLLQEFCEELRNEYRIQVDYFACDLAKDPKAVYDFCKEKGYTVSVLVNNAGYGDYGRFDESDLDKDLGMIELNNKALVALTYHCLNDMKKQGDSYMSTASLLAGLLETDAPVVRELKRRFSLNSG